MEAVAVEEFEPVPLVWRPPLQWTKGWLRKLIGPLRILTKERGIKRLDEVVNYAQTDFINECERQIVETGQVRIAVLKARQIGISTIIEAIMFIFGVMTNEFNGMVMAHDADSSERILAMATRYWDLYPAKQFHSTKYKGKKHLAWDDIGSSMVVKTAGNETAGRSNTIHGLHASEVAFWPDPETLMTGLRQAIPSFGLTFIFLESTANGIGNYFHTVCMEAMRGDNEFTFRFYPWHEHPEYTAKYIPEHQRGKYLLENMTDEELRLKRLYKVSDARLVWRRYAIKNLCQGSLEKFHQEYPSDPHEAFVSTGRNVFPINELIAHYEPRNGERGTLVRNDATRKIEFRKNSEGWLTVYSHPSLDRAWGVYLVGADPTHTYAGDNAVAQVLNRRTGEQVAVLREKITPIPFGKHLQMLATYYNQAMLAVENEGPGYGTVGCIVGDGYPNVYQRSELVSAQGKPLDKYGWSTNIKTKSLAVSHLLQHLTQSLIWDGDEASGLLIHDPLTMLELRNYVTKEDGFGFENSDGSDYDDGVMALAIAVTVDDLEPPPPPYLTAMPGDRPVGKARAVKIEGDDGETRTGITYAPAPEKRAKDDGDELDQPEPAWMAWQVPTPHQE